MRMNYMAQIKAFYAKSNEAGLTGMQKALFYEIMGIINAAAAQETNFEWKEYTDISTRQLARQLKACHSTIEKAKKVLVEKGFITVKRGENPYRDCLQYHIIKLYDEKPTTQNQPQPTKDKQAAENQEIVEALAAIEGDAVGTWQVMTDEKGVFHLDKRDAAGFLQVLGVQTCRQYMEQAQSKRSPGAWLYKVLMSEASKARENNKIAAAALELKRKQQEEAQAQQAAALQQAAAGDGDIYSFSMK